MIEATYTALKGLLETTLLPVNDSAVVTDEDELVRATYLILFAPVPDDVESRYAQGVTAAGVAEFDYDLRVVGATHAALLKALDRVRNMVVGKYLMVPGRQPSRMRMEFGKAELDRSVKPGLWVCDTGILFTSRPGGS
jgi:hypothetical protein